jgi:putative ABC transport system permease protein
MQIGEALVMALNAIRDNKLRSSLTLVGVILGVASIIAVMTAVAAIQGSIEAEITAFGAQTFRLQRLPRGFASDEQQAAAKYWPPVTQAEARAIRENVKLPTMATLRRPAFSSVAGHRNIPKSMPMRSSLAAIFPGLT